MTTALIAAAAALGGVLLGFFVRWGEFRREQRFAAYSAFLSSFLDVTACTSPAEEGEAVPEDVMRRFHVEALRARMVQTRHIAPLLAEAEALANGRGRGRENGERRVDAYELATRIATEASRDVSGLGLPF
jgi:hypothetical protein